MKYTCSLIENVCCPFCNSKKGELLYTVTSSEAATHFVLPWKDKERYEKLQYHIETLWSQDTCDIVRCQSCAGIFSFPFVAGDKTFYNLAFDREKYPQEKWEYDRALNLLIESYGSKISDISILEIGAGDGAFLKKLIANGAKPDNVSVIEYSDVARDRLNKLNLSSISNDHIPSQQLQKNWENKFDCILMFQVLEHLDNLDDKLGFLHNCLKDGGQLIFTVPNPDLTEFNEINGALLDMPPNHLSRLSKTSTEKIGHKNLFKFKFFEKEPSDKINQFKYFCIYKYWRRSQFNYSVASYIARLSNAKIKRMIEVIYLIFLAVVNIKYLPKMNFGSSQLIIFEKMIK